MFDPNVHQGSGLKHFSNLAAARQMERDAANYALSNIPGYDLIPAITGKDAFGCELTTFERWMKALNGAASLFGAAHGIVEMGGPATEELADGACMGQQECFPTGTLVPETGFDAASANTENTYPTAIENIQVDKRVVSRDLPNCEFGPDTVPSLVSSSAFHTTLVQAHTPREEIILQLDLSAGGDSFDETLIVPANQPARLLNGAHTTAAHLKSGDHIYMSGNNIALVKKVEHKLYTPSPTQEPDAQGNVLSRVIGTTKHLTNRLLYLYTQDELIKTTPEHPFLVVGKGWMQAGKLQHGDRIQTESGRLIAVDHIKVRPERQMVYNLKVEGTHTFFVGKGCLLVHNGGNCVPGMDLTDLMKDTGLCPTQKGVYEGNINAYADAMRKAPGEPGAWDWNRTATNPLEPMIKDTNGNIIAGHHRFIAAEQAGVTIPDGVVKVIQGRGARVPRPWRDVKVYPGMRA